MVNPTILAPVTVNDVAVTIEGSVEIPVTPNVVPIVALLVTDREFKVAKPEDDNVPVTA